MPFRLFVPEMLQLITFKPNPQIDPPGFLGSLYVVFGVENGTKGVLYITAWAAFQGGYGLLDGGGALPSPGFP